MEWENPQDRSQQRSAIHGRAFEGTLTLGSRKQVV